MLRHVVAVLLVAVALAMPDPASIGVLIVSDEAHIEPYHLNFMTVQCMCTMRGYTLFPMKPVEDKHMKDLHNFWYAKIMTVYDTLLAHPEIEWLVVLDGDVVVMNPEDHRIEDYLGNHVQDLILTHRFHNNEIMAGHYIIRNTAWSHQFVLEWATSLIRSKSIYHGPTDQGALIWMLLHRFISDEQRDPECVRLGSHPGLYNSFHAYPPFVTCVYRNLGRTGCTGPLWHHVLIFPHGKGFGIDYWHFNGMWSDETFMFHAFKPHDARPEFAQCPPCPVRSNCSNYVSVERYHQLMEQAAKDVSCDRRHWGYDPKSCVNNMYTGM
jgi:hypothetical protein